MMFGCLMKMTSLGSAMVLSKGPGNRFSRTRLLKDVSPESRSQSCAAQPRSKDNNSQYGRLYAAFADALIMLA